MKKSEKGFSIIEGLLILLTMGLIGFVGWYVWHERYLPSKTASNTSTEATQSVDTFDKLPTSNERDLKTYTDRAQNINLQYPGSWTVTETPPPSRGLGQNANEKAAAFASPNAPTMSSDLSFKNSVSVNVYINVNDSQQTINEYFGYESPGKLYLPQPFNVNGKKAYYLKVIKEYYIDHSVVILDGNKAVTLHFREKQNASLSPGVTTFDASTDLSGYKAMVSSVTFL